MSAKNKHAKQIKELDAAYKGLEAQLDAITPPLHPDVRAACLADMRAGILSQVKERASVFASDILNDLEKKDKDEGQEASANKA